MNIGNRFAEKVIAVYFFALTVMMYYFLDNTLNFKLSITFRHLFGLIIIASALICFMIKPNIARASVSFKSACVMGLPLLVTLTASMLVWVLERSELHVITRGLSYYFIFMNSFHAALTAAMLLYLFGEKAIWMNLGAIVTANLMFIAAVVAKNGVGPFVSEFITLVMTFAGNTGDVIRQAEVHELAFCLGAYLLYMLLFPKKGLGYLIGFSLAGFCFVAAFKRIAVIAVAAALAVGIFCRFLKAYGKQKLVSKLITVTMILAVVVLFAYIGIVKSGVFQRMEEAGIDTSGRARIYRAVDSFYEFSPRFVGNGMGFLTFKLNSGFDIGVGAVHNDFLDYFINLGFWGFLLWLVTFTLVRTRFFGRDGFTDGEISAAAILLYVLIVSATDNTMNYHVFNTTVATLLIGHGYEQQAALAQKRLFGRTEETQA